MPPPGREFGGLPPFHTILTRLTKACMKAKSKYLPQLEKINTLMGTPKSHPYGYAKIPPLWVRQNPTLIDTPKSHRYGYAKIPPLYIRQKSGILAYHKEYKENNG